VAHDGSVLLTADSFRALARSSPWRWSSLHLRHRDAHGAEPDWSHWVEAWLVRPDGVLVVDEAGRRLPPSIPDQRPEPSGPWRPPDVTFRPDGLVAEGRVAPLWDPAPLEGLYWHNYFWLAMLDPFELSHHVGLSDLRADRLGGREVWWARARPERGYEPRCGGNCCELLPSEAGLLADFETWEDVPEGWPRGPYPEAHDVALDVATGVVARIVPVGEGRGTWLENDVLEAS